MNIHNTVDTILYHTVDCNYNTLATGHQYNTKLLCFCHTPPSGHIHPYAGSGSILMLLMLTQRRDIASYCIATCDRTKAVANQLMVDSLNPENSCWRWAPSLPTRLSITFMTYGNVGTVEIKDDAIRAYKSTWHVISVSLCFYISTLFLLM